MDLNSLSFKFSLYLKRFTFSISFDFGFRPKTWVLNKFWSLSVLSFPRDDLFSSSSESYSPFWNAIFILEDFLLGMNRSWRISVLKIFLFCKLLYSCFNPPKFSPDSYFPKFNFLNKFSLLFAFIISFSFL
jgi:hypothetical protein